MKTRRDNMTSKIKVEDFNFYYGEKKALDNINLQIEERKITALIGPSGCGKSTFLRSLNRMNDFISDVKYEGKILINNNDILTENIDTIELRKSVGMVFQKANVFPKSIYENVIYGPKRYGIKDKNKLDEIVESSLKRASLWNEVKDVLNKSAFRLSGGQQQRLCIARALASKPDIILMDEPTSALDPISTLKIEELMEELKKNYTVVVVTHNMEQAARTSDYTAFFLNGKLIEMDITNNIFSNPKNKKTEDYISGRFG
ncbi:phosphate ABC transporter ATP-binding protein [Clostridium argentinense]|nr:phosphate ABC transporter ATP-binding protein [Clostridium argentinense]NFF40157.1 phosphate ABC transporter ATP-binding protein [Clostridium argentinense]NFP50640.1 phosphate ABC transporter ATP-binding protein [Clostridium argentinense]NFP72412.1 phosphate ABC transporter ATP-binding protein [Clostridium argentinense]NFP75569.1 phosphate ABC transporter ATP-binding protein [Clostridium argentinense]